MKSVIGPGPIDRSVSGDRVKPLACISIFTLACLFGTTGRATAQQPPRDGDRVSGRVAIFGTLGYNGQWDDESRLGQGVTFNGGVGYRLARGLWIEGLVNRMQHRRDLLFYQVTEGPTGPSATPYPATLTGSATYLLAQVRYVFSTSRVRPYAAGAFGVMHYAGNGWGAVFPAEPGAATPAAGIAATTAAKGVTGGVDVAVAEHLTLGPYFGLLMSDNDRGGTRNALQGGVRIGVGW